MKFILVLLAVSFSLLSCGVNNKNLAEEIRKGDQVDQADYRSLVSLKWCQPIATQQRYVVSWYFFDNQTAFLMKHDVETKQLLQQQDQTWQLVNKTLTIKDAVLNSAILTKEISFQNDFATGKRFMVWKTPNSSLAADTMNLIECE